MNIKLRTYPAHGDIQGHAVHQRRATFPTLEDVVPVLRVLFGMNLYQIEIWLRRGPVTVVHRLDHCYLDRRPLRHLIPHWFDSPGSLTHQHTGGQVQYYWNVEYLAGVVSDRNEMSESSHEKWNDNQIRD